MSDIDRLMAAMRGPEPPSEPPELPAEEEEESEATGPGYVPMLLAAMVLLGIGVVTLSPDRDEPTSSSEPAEIRADPEPSTFDDLPPPPVDGGGPDSVEPEEPERKTAGSERLDAGSGTGAPPAARDPERCLAQYSVEDARYELEVAEGGMVIGLDLIDPVNPDLEGCLRRALLGTMKEGEVGTVNQAL
ncbi:MAG TPA: hypothetical protein QGF58_10245 [Myxococcota bacterium]|nr:hypothetical protein [Myxococcota bacterium]